MSGGSTLRRFQPERDRPGLHALAAIDEGKSAQAFPSFGPERRGAPVMAFTRVADEYIYIRTGITEPDVVVVLDPTVMGAVNVTSGLKEGGIVVANTSIGKEELTAWSTSDSSTRAG
jgi:pyruvate ferredoxin oxidoreductase gamma subunit